MRRFSKHLSHDFQDLHFKPIQEKDAQGGMERANAALALGHFVSRLIPKQHDP